MRRAPLEMIRDQHAALGTQRSLAVLPLDPTAQLDDLAAQLFVGVTFTTIHSRRIVSSA
jgi:hypothetical protein